jgi:hypothetical protein
MIKSGKSSPTNKVVFHIFCAFSINFFKCLVNFFFFLSTADGNFLSPRLINLRHLNSVN